MLSSGMMVFRRAIPKWPGSSGSAAEFGDLVRNRAVKSEAAMSFRGIPVWMLMVRIVVIKSASHHQVTGLVRSGVLHAWFLMTSQLNEGGSWVGDSGVEHLRQGKLPLGESLYVCSKP